MLQLAAVLPDFVLERKFASLLASFRNLENLNFAIELWNGRRFEFGAPRTTFRFKSPRSLGKLFNPSLDAVGEAYVEGELDVEGHIREVVATAARLVNDMHQGALRHLKPPRIKHTKRLDAESIQHHYDVSNEFYRGWLDERMVYSCAYFHHPDDSLETAQLQKIDHILTKIRLQPGEHLLDVGCGWGALVIRAAQEYGARCVGITLSQRQYELANERVQAAGLAGRVVIRLQDYRDVQGRFDKITSVGMFEHVGLANLRGYFERMQSLLVDGGVMMNHGITSTDPESGETPFGGGRFIDRYVFPNGELPHISLALRELSAAGLEATDVENLRLHYAKTLDRWTDRFEARGADLRELVGDKRYRVWRAYLAGCAHGFRQNWMALHQIVAVKPFAGSPEHPVLPMTRDYMYPR